MMKRIGTIMEGVRTIIKKEVKGFVQDRRLMITTVFLPGFLLFAIYSVMGRIINKEKGYPADLSADGNILSVILPVVLVVFVFIGCISAGTESIAGEKERGTLAAILVTPVKRSSIALGKILSLSMISVLSGIFSTLGFMLALPFITGSKGTAAVLPKLGIKGYLAVLLLTALLAAMSTGFVALISMFAKRAKEAQAYTLPLIIIITAVCFAGILNGAEQKSLWLNLIPVYGSIKCLGTVFAGNISSGMLAAAAASDLLCIVLETVLLSEMLEMERFTIAEG